MTEWVLLLLLVPAIVVPVVLLVGFAGCDLIFPLRDPPKETFASDFSGDLPGVEGRCLVQRITRLSESGGEVFITLRASTAGAASIDRVYISQPVAAGDGDLYDSAGDRTRVFDKDDPPGGVPFLVPMGDSSVLLPPVVYTLTKTQPLLIAFDFSSAPASVIRVLNQVPDTDAVAFFGSVSVGPQAAQNDRSTGYVPMDSIFLIAKIDVL